jgi:tetratricopeptide (TPR) repeat protein
MKNEKDRTLIPAYRDMDAYGLPDEFSHFQALDMGKIGFIQDLMRGVSKILDENKNDEVKTASEPVMQSVSLSAQITALLKRAYLFLEDGDYKSANEYFERVLDIQPEEAKAYTGKLMAELKINDEKKLVNSTRPLTDYGNYNKAVRFSEEGYRTVLTEYNRIVCERAEARRKEDIYQKSVQDSKTSTTAEQFTKISACFNMISG